MANYTKKRLQEHFKKIGIERTEDLIKSGYKNNEQGKKYLLYHYKGLITRGR